MALSRAGKEERLAQLQGEFGAAESVVLVDYKGLDVPRVTELRRKFREAGTETVVETVAGVGYRLGTCL